MNKKITIALAILALLLIGGIAYLYTSLDEQKKVNQDMQELAELDKKEMQNEYEKFAQQYSEMKNQINNDSIVAQLTQEQLRTQQLLQELKNVKATDAREITRLKKELATCRAIIRSYVLEIDSLNRLNQNLTAENTRVKGQYEEATRQIEGLNAEKTSLTEKVAIAAQLDAIGISVTMNDKKGKATKKINKAYTTNRFISAEHPGDGKTPTFANGNGMAWELTDYLIQEASYGALKDVTIGYRFNKKQLRPIHLNTIRLYFSAQNLAYVWGKGYKGINPEARYTSNQYSSPLIDGYQRCGFPIQRTYTVGVEIGF